MTVPPMPPTPPRRIVVTGAASGIGAALAARLAREGHHVAGIDRPERTADLPAGVHPVGADLTDPGAIAAAAQAVDDWRAGAPLDGVAAAAGVPGTAPSAVVLGVNLVGLRALTAALLPALGPGSAIVLLASLAGYRGPAADEELPGLLALPDDALAAHVARAGLDGADTYRLSKQLVLRLTLELSARLRSRGIRVTSVSPGPVDTPILPAFAATMPSLAAATDLLGRSARPEEVAAAVAFALSPEASWVNGVDLRVDGGLTALRATTPTLATPT